MKAVNKLTNPFGLANCGRTRALRTTPPKTVSAALQSAKLIRKTKLGDSLADSHSLGKEMNYVLFPHSFSLGAAQPHRILKSIPQNLGVSASSAVCAYLLSRRSGLAHYPVHTAYTVFVIVFRVET